MLLWGYKGSGKGKFSNINNMGLQLKIMINMRVIGITRN